MTQSRLPDDLPGGHSVYDELRARIVDGVLSPGTPLVEGPLAREFGVSRTPIRETLSQLTYEGLLERHDRAMRVRVLKAEDVLEIYEVRIALERAAARAAAERRTELDLGAMGHILDDMQALDEAPPTAAPSSPTPSTSPSGAPATTRRSWRPWRACTYGSWACPRPPRTTRSGGRCSPRSAPRSSTPSASATS